MNLVSWLIKYLSVNLFFYIIGGHMKEYHIQMINEGQNLLKFLSHVLPGASIGLLHKSLRNKNIVLNEKKAVGKEILCEGDVIKVWFSDETIEKFSPMVKVKEKTNYLKKMIVYEDDQIVICNKPANMLSQSDGSNQLSLNDYLLQYYGKMEGFTPSICNRLDRNTTGLIVCGKTIQALQKMNELFRERKIHKYYNCIVAGNLEGKGILKGWLKKDTKDNRVMISDIPDAESRYVETQYDVIKSICRSGYIYSLVNIKLITGRPHQIRAHMAYMGHPILGDKKYGNAKSLEISEKFSIQRQLLQCSKLCFPVLPEPWNEISNKEIIIDLPKDMNLLL